MSALAPRFARREPDPTSRRAIKKAIQEHLVRDAIAVLDAESVELADQMDHLIEMRLMDRAEQEAAKGMAHIRRTPSCQPMIEDITATYHGRRMWRISMEMP